MTAILAADFDSLAATIPGVFTLVLLICCCIVGWRHSRRRGARKPVKTAFAPVIAFVVLFAPVIYIGVCVEHTLRIWRVRRYAQEEKLPIVREDKSVIVFGIPNQKTGQVTHHHTVDKTYPGMSAVLIFMEPVTAAFPVFVLLISVLGLPRGKCRERLLNAEALAASAPPPSDDPAHPV